MHGDPTPIIEVPLQQDEQVMMVSGIFSFFIFIDA